MSYQRLIEDRTRARQELASGLAHRALAAVSDAGYEAKVIGSLATGTFMLHSDVDVLVRSRIDISDRIKIERIFASTFRSVGIPYDLIFKSDLTPADAEAFDHA
jgi:predicted nucleotidyltransferase